MKRPLVLAAGAFAAGIIAANPWVALFFGAAGAWFALRAWRGPGLAAGVVLLWLAAGSLRGWTAFGRAAPDHYSFHAAGDGPVRCAVILEEEPRRFLSDRGFSAGWSAGGRVISLVRDGRTVPVSGKVRLVFAVSVPTT